MKCHENSYQNNKSAISDSKRRSQNIKYKFNHSTVKSDLPEVKTSGVSSSHSLAVESQPCLLTPRLYMSSDKETTFTYEFPNFHGSDCAEYSVVGYVTVQSCE
jgi:hypothetical protein